VRRGADAVRYGLQGLIIMIIIIIIIIIIIMMMMMMTHDTIMCVHRRTDTLCLADGCRGNSSIQAQPSPELLQKGTDHNFLWFTWGSGLPTGLPTG
jgi:hypothetical protein